MTESQGIKGIVNQMAIHMATPVMMVFRDTDAGSQPTNMTSHMEP